MLQQALRNPSSIGKMGIAGGVHQLLPTNTPLYRLWSVSLKGDCVRGRPFGETGMATRPAAGERGFQPPLSATIASNYRWPLEGRLLQDLPVIPRLWTCGNVSNGRKPLRQSTREDRACAALKETRTENFKIEINLNLFCKWVFQLEPM